MSKKLGSHLTYEHRCQIQGFLQNGFSKRQIGRFRNLDHTVVVREIKRNSITGAYSAEDAEATAKIRRFLASSKRKTMTQVRQYLAKGTDFRQVDSSNIISIEYKLNNRSRKSPGFQTPAEAMQAMIQPYALASGM